MMSSEIKQARLGREQMETVFNLLKQHYKIIAPVEKQGEGRFSNTNLVTYDEITSPEQIEFNKQTYFSAKHIVFPIRQVLFAFQNKTVSEETCETMPVIIFLRSCDIHAIRVMDTHFLKEGGCEDIYYKKLRDKLKIFLIECAESFENCFCVSMGTNETNDYSAFMRKKGDTYEIQVKDNQLKQYFDTTDEPVKKPQFVRSNPRSVMIPQEIDTSIFKDKMWKEYSSRCISCGRCTVSCPTCTCFTVQDIISDEDDSINRTRIWSSCHIKEFALLAGNHDFRSENGDRMRYRTLHKISDYKKRTGYQMCVGCGRCDDVCPSYISLFKCIETINEVVRKGKNE